MQTRKNTGPEALAGIRKVLIAAFIIAALYFGREILIPLALAALLGFILSPLATRLEGWIGRVAAILTVILMLLVVVGSVGWVFTRQLVDVASQIPNYKVNIEKKVHGFQLPGGGILKRWSQMIDDLKRELPSIAEPATPASPSGLAGAGPKQTPPLPVRVVSTPRAGPGELLEKALRLVLGPLGKTAIVLLLLIFILLQREEIRMRIIRLIGPGNISATARAMDDAGSRVRRVLLVQLLINGNFAICLAIGLSLIGIPSPVMWGGLAGVLRFIPYIGPWLGAAGPLALSLAVSSGWLSPILTAGLFFVLEMINANVLEPWLYGESAGIMPLGLVLSAVFWAWIWGPVGLILTTPLTVCLTVMGRNVPGLQFLSSLLSREGALAPDEKCYDRLLAVDRKGATRWIYSYVKSHSLTDLYDTVLVPVITKIETDCRRGLIDDSQRVSLLQNVRDILNDLAGLPIPKPKGAGKRDRKPATSPVPHAWRVLCVPATAERDELAGMMLSQLLQRRGIGAHCLPANLPRDELFKALEQTALEAACISVVSPSTLAQARGMSARLREVFGDLKIVVGTWGANGTKQIPNGNGVVVSLEDAVERLAQLFSRPDLPGTMGKP